MTSSERDFISWIRKKKKNRHIGSKPTPKRLSQLKILVTIIWPKNITHQRIKNYFGDTVPDDRVAIFSEGVETKGDAKYNEVSKFFYDLVSKEYDWQARHTWHTLTDTCKRNITFQCVKLQSYNDVISSTNSTVEVKNNARLQGSFRISWFLQRDLLEVHEGLEICVHSFFVW